MIVRKDLAVLSFKIAAPPVKCLTQSVFCVEDGLSHSMNISETCHTADRH